MDVDPPAEGELEPGWDGMPALPPERPPPEGEGMLGEGLLRPAPPALPLDPPDAPPPEDGEGGLGEGMDVEED
jgi:hypothetical protein